jgi:hypothetical protein
MHVWGSVGSCPKAGSTPEAGALVIFRKFRRPRARARLGIGVCYRLVPGSEYVTAQPDKAERRAQAPGLRNQSNKGVAGKQAKATTNNEVWSWTQKRQSHHRTNVRDQPPVKAPSRPTHELDDPPAAQEGPTSPIETLDVRASNSISLRLRKTITRRGKPKQASQAADKTSWESSGQRDNQAQPHAHDQSGKHSQTQGATNVWRTPGQPRSDPTWPTHEEAPRPSWLDKERTYARWEQCSSTSTNPALTRARPQPTDRTQASTQVEHPSSPGHPLEAQKNRCAGLTTKHKA